MPKLECGMVWGGKGCGAGDWLRVVLTDRAFSTSRDGRF